MSALAERLPSMDAAQASLERIPVVQGSRRPGLLPSLAARIEAFFVQHRDKLAWLRAVMFLFFLALILLPLFLPEPA